MQRFIVGGANGQLATKSFCQIFFEPDSGLVIHSLVLGHEAQGFTELILWRLLHPHQESASAIRLRPMLDMVVQFLPTAEIEIAHAEIGSIRKAKSALKCREGGLIDVVKDLGHSRIPVSVRQFEDNNSRTMENGSRSSRGQ
jgi:hypothetical protein